MRINNAASKVANQIFDLGGRCIRSETSSDKRFDLDFYICNGRLVIVQVFKELEGVEVFSPMNNTNCLDDLLENVRKYFYADR